MELYLLQFVTIATLHLLALISPGPDFVMVTRNSLSYSRKAGVFTALGLSLGMLVHVTYSLVGIAYIIAQSVVVFNVIKVLGGVYLIYLGIQAVLSKETPKPGEVVISTVLPLNNFAAMRMGFLTNLLNPKVTLFFLAVFTQVIDTGTPIFIKVLYAAEMMLATFLWFSLVAYVFSHNNVRQKIDSVKKYIDKTFGAILIILGLKVVLSK